MDIKAFIASGILEQYALGLASAEEVRQVEDALQKYPELKAELASIQAAFEQLALAQAVQPKAGLLDNILQQVEKDVPKPAPPAQPAAIAAKKSIPYGWMAMALLLGLAAWYFFRQNQKTSSDWQNRYNTLEQQCETNRQVLEQAQADLKILSDPGNQPIRVLGLPALPEAVAVVYYNTEAQTTYFQPLLLPPPPAGKQYQLWALVDGQPRDMGILALEAADLSLANVPFVAGAGAFAITIEPLGGSPSPSLDQLVMMGAVNAG